MRIERKKKDINEKEEKRSDEYPLFHLPKLNIDLCKGFSYHTYFADHEH